MLLFITTTKNLSLGQCLPHRPWARAKTPDVTQALLFSCCMTSGSLIPPSFSLGLSFLNCRVAGWAWIICTVLSIFLLLWDPGSHVADEVKRSEPEELRLFVLS